jgi:hypothetical protein
VTDSFHFAALLFLFPISVLLSFYRHLTPLQALPPTCHPQSLLLCVLRPS